MKITTCKCDMEGCDNLASSGMFQVIFTTDQTEGRSTNPYLSREEIDMCPECELRVLRGDAIWGYGAQGHNVFKFREKK